jgi:hypothetical protein
LPISALTSDEQIDHVLLALTHELAR